MLLSEIPSNPPGAGGVKHSSCDCDDCHDVKPPSHLLFTPTMKLSDWEDLVCPSGRTTEGIISADISVCWTPTKQDHNDTDIAAQEAAIQLVSQLTPDVTEENGEYVEALTSYLVQFADLVGEQLEDPFGGGAATLKARIVASRGTAGTKCPLWHVDNVPIRWIQALVGPGCEFVTNVNAVNWEAWKDDRLLRKRVGSVEATNQYRIPSAAKAGVYKAKTQEVALLRGGRWNDCRKVDFPECLPVVHRSPACIPSYQQRLVLTQDVVLD